jgi:hypothetical protein
MQHMGATQSFTDHRVTLRIDAVHLEHLLRKIETDCGNLHGGWLLSVVANQIATCLALRCREREPSTSSVLKIMDGRFGG